MLLDKCCAVRVKVLNTNNKEEYNARVMAIEVHTETQRVVRHEDSEENGRWHSLSNVAVRDASTLSSS